MKIFNALRKRITASAQPCQSASSLPRHSLRMLLALSILLALLAACGDESSSSVSPEPRQCEEQSDDCDDVSSSSEKISKNSSSSQKSADKGKSSSSEKNAKESSSSATTKNSSSSVGGDKSSSSVKKEDSSSSVEIASSSSVTPESSSTVTSSAAVASSSSVAVQSSSSEYEPYNHYADLGSTVVSKSEYKQFTDSRNGRSYYYLTIDGVDKDGNPASVTVFAENLNIGVMVDGDKDQTNDLEIERYCYDNDTTNCDKYGGLYQWAEMMKLSSECNTKSCANLIKPNHQGICPDGWRLLTEDDFYIVMHANENDAGAKGVRATSFGGLNYSGYSLLGAGYNWAYEFDNIDDGIYWHYPEQAEKNPDIGSVAGSTARSLNTASSKVAYKTHGFSVRCVMVE
ncbi:major paralogous domain-containing protein [Fibrobacter sp. UWOV1]|uniref:FISUMP domain-containing protein n=1 Tax=Fibrobacter sp. UWOV1 TaxID=1896215 RepID=UPI000915C43F|nr:FISUMP domain-containing protein [Fibrobacter sp. UWOV1]SHL46964.1 major paralogous domain-containing protein [Fibrobacter sp. UWOV1]